MSYDLFFTEPSINRNRFMAFFEKRSHYTLGSDQANYENEDTGVYFSFDYSEEGEEESNGYASFNLNYYRPQIFCLEAEPEVRAFVDYFKTLVVDPQGDSDKEGHYTTAKFFEGWNAGNSASYRIFLKDKEQGIDLFSYPTREINVIWQWNFEKEARQTELGESIYVPSIFFILVEGCVKSAVVWTDGVSTLIPNVDVLIIYRDKLAPRRFFRTLKDICILPFREAMPILSSFQQQDTQTPVFSLQYSEVPNNIKTFITSLKPFKGDLKRLSMDQVLDFEIVQSVLDEQ